MKHSLGPLEKNIEGKIGTRLMEAWEEGRRLQRRAGLLPRLNCRPARPLRIRRHLRMPYGINAFLLQSVQYLRSMEASTRLEV